MLGWGWEVSRIGEEGGREVVEGEEPYFLQNEPVSPSASKKRETVRRTGKSKPP